ncbi:MAG: hypothetical protein GX921_09190, partial [Bacteroidales bacterium]|nr:hypothetical protein [Bacteroidales bacterium]
MRKNLKVKIFSSFMLLVAMLLIAGVMSIWELNKMNSSYSNVIDHNYLSIEHALKVTHALEREDSGILMFFLGNRDEAMSVFESADSNITLSMIEIKKNATEPGEDELIENIENEYNTYSRLLDSVITNNIGNNQAVYKSLHSQFTKTKKTVTSLMELNQSNMYSKANEMHHKLYQTIMPSIVSIILAIVFALLLNFYISHYFVNPLNKIITATQNYIPPSNNINVDIKSEDELKTLQLEI